MASARRCAPISLTNICIFARRERFFAFQLTIRVALSDGIEWVCIWVCYTGTGRVSIKYFMGFKWLAVCVCALELNVYERRASTATIVALCVCGAVMWAFSDCLLLSWLPCLCFGCLKYPPIFAPERIHHGIKPFCASNIRITGNLTTKSNAEDAYNTKH